MSNNNFKLDLNNFMENMQDMMKEVELLKLANSDLKDTVKILKLEVEDLEDKKSSIILEKDKNLEINKKLYRDLDEKADKLIKENSRLRNEVMPKESYIDSMKEVEVLKLANSDLKDTIKILKLEVEDLEDEKSSIILEKDKNLEINKKLYRDLDEKADKLIKENSRLRNEVMPKESYIDSMKEVEVLKLANSDLKDTVKILKLEVEDLEDEKSSIILEKDKNLEINKKLYRDLDEKADKLIKENSRLRNEVMPKESYIGSVKEVEVLKLANSDLKDTVKVLKLEVEDLEDEKSSIILEKDKNLEINKVLYKNLDDKIDELIKENSRLKIETVPKKNYIDLMKLNGYLAFDLEQTRFKSEKI